MNMDFPHPRRGLQQANRRSNFAALVATASARQTLSRTTRAMLTAGTRPAFSNDTLSARIAYFANQSRGLALQTPSGGFLPRNSELPGAQENKNESAVYLTGSTKCKSPALVQVLSDCGHAVAGQENLRTIC